MVGLEKSVELVELVGLDGVARGWRGEKEVEVLEETQLKGTRVMVEMRTEDIIESEED